MLQSDLVLPVCKGVREKRGFCSKGGWREEECEKGGWREEECGKKKEASPFTPEDKPEEVACSIKDKSIWPVPDPCKAHLLSTV